MRLNLGKSFRLMLCMLCMTLASELSAQGYGILVNGSDYYPGVKNDNPQDKSFQEYAVLGVKLSASDYLQLYDNTSKATWVVDLDTYSVAGIRKEPDRYVCETEGCYDFYIKLKYQADQLYVGKGTCGIDPPGPGPTPGSSVPSQCEDVLMQAFYYDSYEVDSTHAGTELYGDTKWKTLYRQVGEIGAYFDLVWLPPSAYSSGVGYHPRQYSNQNSDWGSRAELEQLIAAFHNTDTKVIADMVINHAEAMASWCDFPTLNFGEYGTFKPDGSYICKTDEMNWEKNKADSLAGECWGTATGPADDGENWEGARDWAHDSEPVREMMRAYAKWMINEMHYDGFRYDKGDGFHQSHMNDYNQAANAYMAFMEYWSGNNEIIQGIKNANYNVMALDFQTKYSAFDGIAGWNFQACKGSGLLGRGMAKYAITFVDSHDWFLRGNGQEFGGNGNSLKPEMKNRLLCANAFMLSMPGVPCVFYPHWVKYKAEIKDMINARHMAGVHSESNVKDEYASSTGYQVTVEGKKGWLILCLGDRAKKAGFEGFTLVASGYGNMQGHSESYEIWVSTTKPTAPGLIVTQSTSFSDSIKGIEISLEAVAGSSADRKIYYTTDGTDPTLESPSISGSGKLTFTKTTTLKVMAACGEATTTVQTYTYTYREPLKTGIQVHFNKPEVWEKAYIYAWIPGVDAEGNVTTTNIMGAYPGQRIYQDAEGWYSYEFDAEMDSVNFCINSGNDCGGINVRSNDLVADYHVYYAWEEGFETENQYEKLLEDPQPLSPDFDLVISPETGDFRDQTAGQVVKMTVVGRPGAMIYYSTDGSDPADCVSPVMDTITLVLHQTATVRAYAYDAASKERTPEYAQTYTYKAPQSGPIRVKFFKPHEWQSLYLYAFTRVKKGNRNVDTPYPLDGKTTKWPGMPWTTFEKVGGDSVYYFQMKPEIKEIYVIFTEGNKKPQTQDIFLDEDVCYIWNQDCYRAVVSVNCDGKSPVEEVFTEQKKHFNKQIINNHLVIDVNGVRYDAMGRRLK